MEIENKLLDLKNKWKKERPQYTNFVNDGILSYSEYDKQNPKILFLLKESHSGFVNIAPLPLTESNGWGPNGSSKTFWRYMRAYEHTIQCAFNNIPFNQKLVYEIRNKKNINTAYVNIKKQCGNNKKSDDKEIEMYAHQDRTFLIKQIDIINPDVIYCGGTISSYQILYEKLNLLTPRVYKSNDRLIINYHHLAHRRGYKTFKELYDLVNAANKL